MRTMTKEKKKEGPRLGHKGRADAKASRQLLLLCIPAIIGYILFNYIPMGAAVIIPFKNYKFSKGHPRQRLVRSGQLQVDHPVLSRLTVRCATRCSMVFCSWCSVRSRT